MLFRSIPHDETTISSEIDVNAVIELQAGISAKLHIKIGDVAKWKAVAPATPPG